jgi:Coenzyme PQQ synthesis protein D (PqqD)
MINKGPLITLGSIVQQNTGNLLTSEIGEELIMMDIDGGNYINLNKVGRIIWEQMEQPLKVSDLIDLLMIRFKAGRDECLNDTLEYLQNMLAQKVIVIIE